MQVEGQWSGHRVRHVWLGLAHWRGRAPLLAAREVGSSPPLLHRYSTITPPFLHRSSTVPPPSRRLLDCWQPENLLLDTNGYVKLADLGFAKVMQGQSWTLCGTPEYLAPEMLQHRGHSFPVDWWAVGVFAFECLQGASPFAAPAPIQVYHRYVTIM